MESYDLVVIGAGPGGYVGAIRAAQLGLKVALVDENPALGGTCLRVGCIPSKALLESSHMYSLASSHLAEHGVEVEKPRLDLSAMMKRKDQVVEQLTTGVAGLMKNRKVSVFQGVGSLLEPDRVSVRGESPAELGAKNILLATGSVPVELPDLPFDGTRIVSSTEALSFDAVPGHLLVVGAGAIGLELGQVWSRLGAKVTMVELLPQVAPFADKMIARMLMRSLKDQGMEFKLNTRVTAADTSGDSVRVTLTDAKDQTEELACDKVLVAVGRRPNTRGLGLEKAGVALASNGGVEVDESLRTNVDSVYAIGDLVRGPMLAHKAEEEGIAVAESLAGLPGHVNYEAIPGVVYTAPELAMVGKTEEECKQEGIPHKTGRFYFRANGRAIAAGQTDGLSKIIAHEETDKILGVHIVGQNASELIAEAVVAMEFGASAEDLARTCHAHPTLSEAVKESALAVDGRAIHA